jgi:hypothetical protein
MSKFYFEIPMHDYDSDYIYSYDTLIAEGDSLEECLMNAVVTVVDAEGCTVDIAPADAIWMQDLVKRAFWTNVPALKAVK